MWRSLALALVFGFFPGTGAQADGDEAAERLAGAIRLRTVSYQDRAAIDAAEFRALHAYLAESYPLVHARLEVETVAELSLLFTWRGSDPNARPFLMTSHLDVVPVPDDTLVRWSQPPFSGAIRDGYVWGRGTLDNKSGVTATLEAVETLLAQGFSPTRTLYLAFGHDEELGGAAGAGAISALLADRGVQLEFSLDEGLAVVDGSLLGLNGAIALVGVAEKGSVTLRLTARARGGHSSLPSGDSAIGRLARAIQRVEAAPLPARLDEGAAAAMFDALAPHMDFVPRTVIEYRSILGPLLVNRLSANPLTSAMIRTTTAVTIVQGGVKSNVLPSEASATVNFRLIPGDTAETVSAHVEAAIADPEVEIKVVGTGREASAVSSWDARGFELIREALAETMPDVVLVAPALLVAGTDSKHYAKVADDSYRFLPLRFGADDGARFHGVDERIGVDRYNEMIAAFTAFIRRAGG